MIATMLQRRRFPKTASLILVVTPQVYELAKDIAAEECKSAVDASEHFAKEVRATVEDVK